MSSQNRATPTLSGHDRAQLAYESEFWDGQAGTTRRLFRGDWYKIVNRSLWSVVFDEMGDLTDKRVLFIGCGESASIAKRMADAGGDVWCADISAGSLEHLARYPFGEARDRIHPVVADAENMPFEAGSFDVVIGKAIVHHLQIAKFMSELRRVCVSGGKCVLCEPLGTNPFINVFRSLTPRLRVPTEHPLVARDTKLIARYFGSIRIRHTECLSMGSYPFFWVGLDRIGHLLYRALVRIDGVLFRVMPPTRWLAWNIVISGSLNGEPGKGQ